jgi:hypothetical protein
MERETGIGPATNSLEGCQSIEDKQLLRLLRRILTIVLQRVPHPTAKNALKVSNRRNGENWCRWAIALSFSDDLTQRTATKVPG